jgi:hypothetical protein
MRRLLGQGPARLSCGVADVTAGASGTWPDRPRDLTISVLLPR